MAFLSWKSPLTADERVQRRRLIFSDALALSTFLLVTVLLAALTTSLYRSYASHQAALARRWLARGEAALQNGKPEMAIDALRSALALAPGERKIEIELAEALASAGRVQEATSYFSTLAEAEPGSGIIHLHLARLAVQQGNVAQALDDYQKSIYGNWEGDGYIRRREVRMELARFLVSRGLYHQAQSELLVAAGNAPEGDSDVLLEIARWMEKAQDPRDAFNVYRTVLQHHPSLPEALAGAGRSAFETGRYLQAKQYLERSLNNGKPGPETEQSRDLLRDANRLLLLYPSPQLSSRKRSARILADRKIAQTRLGSCLVQHAAAEETARQGLPKSPDVRPSISKSLQGSLAGLASHFKRHNPESIESSPTEASIAPVPSALDTLATRWQQQPASLTLSELENDPDLAQSQIQLIYETEKVTQQVCGGSTGDDALLLKIAQSPSTVEQE